MHDIIKAYAVERIYPQDSWISGIYLTIAAARGEATRALKGRSSLVKVRIIELTGGREVPLKREGKK